MSKQKSLEDLRDLIKSGKLKDNEHTRKQFIEDTNGRNVPLNDPDILDVIDRRLTVIERAHG